MTKDNNLLGRFDLSGIAPAPRGVPQIEVTFEVDVNGILHVSAEDKASGKREQITITNDAERLSEEEIERMIKEAEEMAEEDKKVKDRVVARNNLENYYYQVKNTINDKEKFADKIEEDDKASIEAALEKANKFLESNLNADKEEYDEVRKELEEVVQPIFTKIYQAAGGSAGGAGGFPGGFPGGEEMPDHDEL
eukprot:TRINITY_DN1938_c0_g2_i1.p1 TRINITY_DN1938_c0_g2~~TRINITY_DN1938_c0_g2_i1.p1  ORF type:complete len:201 (-),score=86.43 TRINITY_DN1938_c0_g2_i1:68-649(-)